MENDKVVIEVTSDVDGITIISPSDTRYISVPELTSGWPRIRFLCISVQNVV